MARHGTALVSVAVCRCFVRSLTVSVPLRVPHRFSFSIRRLHQCSRSPQIPRLSRETSRDNQTNKQQDDPYVYSDFVKTLLRCLAGRTPRPAESRRRIRRACQRAAGPKEHVRHNDRRLHFGSPGTQILIERICAPEHAGHGRHGTRVPG